MLHSHRALALAMEVPLQIQHISAWALEAEKVCHFLFTPFGKGPLLSSTIPPGVHAYATCFYNTLGITGITPIAVF